MRHRSSLLARAIVLVVLVFGVFAGSSLAYVGSHTPAGFGFREFAAGFEGDTQAGSHPNLSVEFEIEHEAGKAGFISAGGELRNVTGNAPAGLVGDPVAVPQCTRVQFDNHSCPAATQVGVSRYATGINEQGTGPQLFFKSAVYNLVPVAGEPAQFAFTVDGISTFLDTRVRSGGDYGITADVENVAQRGEGVTYSRVELWGVPGEHMLPLRLV